MSDDLLQQHLKLVIEANKKVNLTRIDSLEDGQLLHIEDSLAGLQEITEAPAGRLGDMGSGAGFPGIPIAITTGRSVTLIETVGKKAHMLESFVETLGLKNVEVYNGRLETLAQERPKSFSVLTARALSKLSVLMEFASPLLIKGGRLVCYKAQPSQEELDHAQSVCNKLGMKLYTTREFLLSDGVTKRTIIVFEKVAEPTIKLPRSMGFAQKKPL